MATQNTSDIDIELYVLSLNIIEWSRLCQVANFTIIIYDLLLTLDEEIEFIWKARLSFGKVIFLFNRYLLILLTIVGMPEMFSPNVTSNAYSSHWVIHRLPTGTVWADIQPFANLIIFISTDAILQMRIYALFEGSKKILLATAIPFVIVSIAALVELVLYAVDERATATPLPGIPNFCEPLHNNYGDTFIYWAELLFLETLFFVLVCVKTFQSYRDEKLSGLSWWHSGTIMHVLLRDSFVYYFGVFVTFLVNVIISPLDDGRLQLPPSLFTSTISGVIGLHLILSIRTNFRDTCEDGQKDDFTLSTWHATPNLGSGDSGPGTDTGDGSENRPRAGSVFLEMTRLPQAALSESSGFLESVQPEDGDETVGLEERDAVTW